MDASSALDAAAVPMTVVAEGPTFPLHGPILSVAPLDEGRHKIEIAGGGDATSRTIVVGIPPGEALPFQVGQVLDVTVRKRDVSVFAADRALEVRDAGGRLMAMEYGSAAAPDDWPAGERGAGGDCFVVVRHANACAFVPTGTWRRLETPDGAWAVHAKCAGAPEPGGRARPGHAPGPTMVQVTRLPR
jgi:hypothetical protein